MSRTSTHGTRRTATTICRWTGRRPSSRVGTLCAKRFVQQLFLLNHILVLKDLGLSLAEIATLLQEGVPLDQLHGMLRLKRAELHEQIAAARELPARVEHRLKQLELGTLPLGSPVDGAEHTLPIAIIGGVLLPGLTVPMQWPPSYGARAFANAAAGNRRVLIVSLDDIALAPWARGEPGPCPPSAWSPSSRSTSPWRTVERT